MTMTDKNETQVPHQHRYTHPNFTEKVKRNEAANAAGNPVSGHKADDNPHAVPATNKGGIDPVNPDGRR